VVTIRRPPLEALVLGDELLDLQGVVADLRVPGGVGHEEVAILDLL
jgi:hypothetical protein